MLRFPTPATLRKEAHADDEAIANTDPKEAKKFGNERVKLVSFCLLAARMPTCCVS